MNIWCYPGHRGLWRVWDEAVIYLCAKGWFHARFKMMSQIPLTCISRRQASKIATSPEAPNSSGEDVTPAARVAETWGTASGHVYQTRDRAVSVPAK